MPAALDRLLPVLFFAAFLAAWQIACDAFGVRDFLLPSPLAILDKMAEVPQRLLLHTLTTLREVLIGFALACAIGIFLATITAHSRVVSRTLFPMLVMSQTIPTIAIAPVLVIWFGPGDAARLIVVFLIAFFPIVVNTTAGLLRVNEELIDLVRGLNASRWKIFVKIRLPNALPHIFTGMRISIALSVIGAVVAEFVAAEQGLGYLVFSANTNLDTKLVFAAVVLLAIMGIVLFQLVRLAQRFAVPWAQTTREGEA
jgi:NitT/TauT family transport system permease protein